MKLNLRTLQILQTPNLRANVETQLEPLHELISIAAAHVLLVKYRDRNPPFFAVVRLEVPGTDIHAADSDQTLAAAFQKVKDNLRRQIVLRQACRPQRLKTRLKMRREPIAF
jgi:ribosome-associated translation inhibitor RaiA